MTEEKTKFPTNQLKKLILGVVSIYALNIILIFLEPSGSTTDLRGQAVSGWAIKTSLIFTLTFLFAILGAILALVVALIPYQALVYGQKYLPALLISFGGLQIIFLILEIKYLLVY